MSTFLLDTQLGVRVLLDLLEKIKQKIGLKTTQGAVSYHMAAAKPVDVSRRLWCAVNPPLALAVNRAL